MRVLVVENWPKTPLGFVGEALADAGLEYDAVRTFAGERLPASDAGYDALVMLGGAQNALDDENHPYLPHEAALARAFGDADKAVLGICLGSQILARAHGATNILGRPMEFGWHQVRTTEAGRTDPVTSVIGENAPIFHWHVDTFTLPPGAVHLATSAHTPMQAFRIGRASYGIQFHFEAGSKLVSTWTHELADEIVAYAPDWAARLPGEVEKHGPRADIVGPAIAHAWIERIRRVSPNRQEPARKGARNSVSEGSA